MPDVEQFTAVYDPDAFKAAFSEERFLAAPVMPGPPGKDGGATRYRYTQSTALDVWTVNHNLGHWPTAVSVRSPGGVEVEAQVTHNSINQLTVSFAGPYAGTVDIL